MEILPFGLFRDEGKERPTGGLVDAPSSKAVEEEGHSEKNCTLCPQFCNPLKHGGKEETEERGNGASMPQGSSVVTFNQFGFFGNWGVAGNFPLLRFLLSSVFQAFAYSARAANSPVSTFPALFICTK